MTIVFYKYGGVFVNKRVCKQGDDVKTTMDSIGSTMSVLKQSSYM